MQRMRLEKPHLWKGRGAGSTEHNRQCRGYGEEVREHQENKKDILSGQAETQSGDSKDEDEETEMKVLDRGAGDRD